ncbi:MAG: thioredoxin family protein [Clostridiales bacterium]|jgi:thioredoxin 1|nr:thioredoxin family protein [Clostridiales bacterium]
MNKKTWLRILVPVMIVAIAGGLYLLKNHQERQKAQEQLQVAGDPALVLEEMSFDLKAYQAHQLPLILDFGAEECGPCQIMRPDLEQAHAQTLGRAVIKFFDVWKRPELAADYPVRVIPSQVILYPDGRPYVPSEAVQAAGLQFAIFDHIETGEHALTMHEGILTLQDFMLILNDMGMAST